MKRNGYTLTEILVSIIIMGIIIACLAQIYGSKARIDQKTALNMQIGEVVQDTFDLFTTKPEKFLDNNGLVTNAENTYYLYYNKSFKEKLNAADENNNYLKLEYLINNNNTYTLKLEVYENGTLKEFEEPLERTVDGE